MPGNRLTLSTDDGEQAGEENDRMAPHHLFHLPSRLEAIFTRPSSSSSSLFSFLAARVDAGGPLSSRATKTRTHWLLRSSRPSRLLSPFPRDIRSRSRARSLDGISLVTTRSPFNVTKDPALGTHITCPLSSRPRSREVRVARVTWTR